MVLFISLGRLGDPMGTKQPSKQWLLAIGVVVVAVLAVW